MVFNVQLALAAIFAVSVSAGPLRVRDASDADIARLTPPFGFESGRNPTGTGDCDGAVNGPNGRPIAIPCACPPPVEEFIRQMQANVHAGHAVNNPSVPVTFPTDDSKDSQLARLEAAKVSLQNLRGPGQGCPVVSTTFKLQEDAIRSGTAPPSNNNAAPAPAPPTPPPAGGGSGGDDIERLTPDLGFQSGLNPTGTGDCDGAVQKPDGSGAIKIPCSCPPNRADFVAAVRANVAAGHAVNNPGVSVSFPLDDSKDSQLARIETAKVSLQNLRGPGVGCPVVSTTLNAQADAVRNGSAPPANANPPPAAPQPAPPAGGGASAGGDDIERLAPDLGFQSGLNPTGTGDCDGAVQKPDGSGAIKIPCSCPPPRDVYINALRENVLAGHAVKNPGVSVSFPLGDSNADKSARITAALIALQNLNGPGVGCPAVSTTLLAQQRALQR